MSGLYHFALPNQTVFFNKNPCSKKYVYANKSINSGEYINNNSRMRIQLKKTILYHNSIKNYSL